MNLESLNRNPREETPATTGPALHILTISVAIIGVFATILSGLVVQSVQTITMLMLLTFFIYLGRSQPDVRCQGWSWILVGLNLIAFGSMISFVRATLLGGAGSFGWDIRFEQWLEQVVGIAVGFTFLAYGFYRWIPAFLESRTVIAGYLERTMHTVEAQKEALQKAEEKARAAEERARMAEDLRRLKEFNDHVLEAVPNGLFTIGDDQEIMSVNAAFEKMFHTSAADAVGHHYALLLDNRKFALAYERISAGEPLVALEFEQNEKTGGESRTYQVWLSSRHRGITVVVVEDVTDRRRAEKMEKQLSMQLVQSEKLSSLGELVSGVAHELNNPLSVISGYAELLESDTDVTEEIAASLREIASASFRCKRIVGNLLTFARQHKPEKEVVDLNRVIEDALSLREYQFRLEGIKLVRELGPIRTTLADPYQLQQVFFNIINNAYQALKGWPGERRLVLSSRLEHGMNVVEIRDSGPGMSQQVLRKIFDPFFTTKAVGEGTGLGLSISFGIVKDHGGQIAVTSLEGEGACFTVRLPLVQKLVQAPEAPLLDRETLRDAVAGRKVLIVDDEDRIVDICRLGLERLGCEVDVASTGAEALAKLSASRFDLIITDMRMPGIGGQELYEMLSTRQPDLACRVIFMTGDTVGSETKTFVDRKSVTCLVKPFGLDDLERTVAQTILDQEQQVDQAA